MKFATQLALLTFLPAVAMATTDAPRNVGLVVQDSVRVMGSTSVQFPVRVDNTLVVKWSTLWLFDMLHYDHGTGKVKNQLNNRVFVGWAPLFGIGPAFQRQDFSGRMPSNYLGASWTYAHSFRDDLKFSNFIEMARGLNVETWRFDEYLNVTLPLGFWVSDSFAMEIGGPKLLPSNKLYVGLAVLDTKNATASVVVNQTVAIGRATVYMAGLEIKLKGAL